MICKKCKVEKYDQYYKNRHVCKDCDKEDARERRKIKASEDKVVTEIICNTCDKKTTDHRVNRKTCKECEKESGRKYRKETDKAKIWAENNKERMRQLQKDWTSNRKKEDPLYNFACKHKSTLCHMVKTRSDTPKTYDYVDCDTDLLHRWFAYYFKDDMTIENHSILWTIDHVLPVHKFLTQELPETVVLTWMNLRPLEKEKNSTKYKYIIEDDITNHLIVLKSFVIENDMTEDRKIKRYIKSAEEFLRNTLERETPKASDTNSIGEIL